MTDAVHERLHRYRLWDVRKAGGKIQGPVWRSCKVDVAQLLKRLEHRAALQPSGVEQVFASVLVSLPLLVRQSGLSVSMSV